MESEIIYTAPSSDRFTHNRVYKVVGCRFNHNRTFYIVIDDLGYKSAVANTMCEIVQKPQLYVKCMTNEYRNLRKFQDYPVERVVESSYGNKNYEIRGSDGGKNRYWAGNFRIVNKNKISETVKDKIYMFTIKDQYGNIEYESDCIDCINTYVRNKEKENHIC